MDTRSKIIGLELAREQFCGTPACWVAGHFDPLLAEHVRRLGEHRSPGRLLIVEVTNPLRPLMQQRARAELVAALSLVDYVVLGNGTANFPVIDDSVTERFIEHVVQRNSTDGAG